MVLLGATGMGPSQFMNQRLWPQLGAECEGAWLTDDRGTELAFGGVNLCLRDFARIGLLFLHGGRSLTGSQIRALSGSRHQPNLGVLTCVLDVT